MYVHTDWYIFFFVSKFCKGGKTRTAPHPPHSLQNTILDAARCELLTVVVSSVDCEGALIIRAHPPLQGKSVLSEPS